MRAILQRVSTASVSIEDNIVGHIERGYLILLGIGQYDTHEDMDYLIKKIVNMRLFPDNEGKMNLSLLDINGQCLVVSQFTLYAQTKKGNRPSFIDAAKPKIAEAMYDKFCEQLSRELGEKIATGRFGAAMEVSLINDGPVTISLDSQDK